ncbi:hypothetical protein UFOVP190_457 [uncultured Caudovirales phage]|jgi:hypothetical protein|uniref:Uncharacterized protein n=1 Tax=uncultured Caudovirales phage TaxID=2100421 RepID=A0A6J7WIA8_9CAUD|nr:hypothetical protein UFOVP190_457 [uncultured Caudovirales phage]
MEIKLDPESGPGFIQKQLPHLTNTQAQLAFWQMRMRDIEMGANTIESDKDLYEAYDQWKFWKTLGNDDTYHGI